MQQEWNIEEARLQTVRELIAKELLDKLNSADDLKNEMRNINKEMWEDCGGLLKTLDIQATFMQHIGFLKSNLGDLSENQKRIMVLEKQYNTPYFCKIDFKEEGYETESFYIGIYGFRKTNKVETLIYDWRAPVSSLFYDYEPGPAHYECPAGIIEGELLLKRQFRIVNGELKLMFDCNVAIEDDILQEILAQNTGNGMKNIVSTIQKEQNRAIRFSGKRILIVSGPAGSGKTSVAMHRAAYLLYRYRSNLRAENIVLFAPNEAFADYISNVLPELGEENIQYHTTNSLVNKLLTDSMIKYQTYEEYIENILLQKSFIGTDKHLDIIRFKASAEFITIIDEYISKLENAYPNLKQVCSDNYTFATREELDRLFHSSFSAMPIAKRLEQIKFMIKTRINEYEPKRQTELEHELIKNDEYGEERDRKVLSRVMVSRELENARQVLDEMCSLNIISIYKKLYSEYLTDKSKAVAIPDMLIKYTLDALDDGILLYEDQAPLLYMMSLLGMIEPDKQTKHVIIDEAQDYSELMYRFIFRLYSHSNIAILGDPNQNVNSYGSISSLTDLQNILTEDEAEYLKLNKSYRSTREIIQFAKRLVPSDVEPFGRQGLEPGIIFANTYDDLCDRLRSHLKEVRDNNYNSIAIICRTLQDCKHIYSSLKDTIEVCLINSGNGQIPAGIIIIPSYLTKGLEFDVVVAVLLSADDYAANEDKLLYTVCTRALHRLDIFSVKNSKVLEKLTN